VVARMLSTLQFSLTPLCAILEAMEDRKMRPASCVMMMF
jgi:hypothetical protein